MKPEDFILNTDYATLKNDATDFISLDLPASFTVFSTTPYVISADKTVGTAGASLRSVIQNSRTAGILVCNSIAWTWSGGSVFGSPANYELFAFVHKPSAGVVRLSLIVPNPYGADMSITGAAQTVRVDFATFLPPQT